MIKLMNGHRSGLTQLVLLFMLLAASNGYSQSPPPTPPCGYATDILDLSNILGSGNFTSTYLYQQYNAPAANLLSQYHSPKWWSPAGIHWALSNNVQNGNPVGAFGTIEINGTFIVDNDCYIDHSEILMGPGAKIIVQNTGHLTITDSYIHACHDLAHPEMWDSISVASGGTISFASNVTIEDAKVGVSLATGSSFNFSRSNFNLNYIGIRILGNSTPATNFMKGLTFTSVTAVGSTTKATLLSPYLNKRSLVGIQVNNRSNFEISGPSTLDKSTFRNLDYGIWAAKSSVIVGNSDFIDIDDITNPIGKNTDIGTGIYVKYPNVPTTIVPQMSLVVGGANTASVLNSCSFSNCKRGVLVANNSNVNIAHNTFTDCSFACSDINNGCASTISFLSNACTNFYQGLRLINCVGSPTFTVSNNTFNVNTALTIGSFSNTGIYMANSPIAYNGAIITGNSFTDVRIGVYTNATEKVQISSNTVTFNRLYTDPTGNGLLGLTHAGFWAEGCDHTDYFDNTVIYTKLGLLPVPFPNKFNSIMRGFNIKGHTNSTFFTNTVVTCGTPVRLVDDLSQTFFTCNIFNGCTQGMKLENANLSTQGLSTKPAGNKWVNYNPTTFRVIGNVALPVTYYFKGAANPTNTAYPSTSMLPASFFTQTTTADDGCTANSPGELIDISAIDRVVLDSITTGDETDQEKERIATFIQLKESLSSNVEYQNWMDSIENTETGYYARLVDTTSSRLSICQALRELTTFRDPSFIIKRDLYADALTNQYFALDSIQIDPEPTSELAYTNAWEGTSAVYLARAILEEEVDDEATGLRLDNSEFKTSNNCNLSYSYYNDQLTLFSNEKVNVELIDSQGRLIEQFDFNNFKQLSRNSLKENHVFILRMMLPSCQKSIKIQ